MILVNDDEIPCQGQDAENFQGFNECMEDAISGHLGCDLPWTNSSNGIKKLCMYFMAMPKCNVISECKDNDSLQKYLALIANDSEFDSLLANSSCLPKKCQKLSWKFHEKRHIADLTTSNWKKVFEGYEGHTIISFRLQNRKVRL